MTLRHFKIFIEVCNQGSMSVAAQKLFISQSAVSQAIKELETHYHAQLFNRISHKLYLTSCGRKLYDYAHHMVVYNDFIEASMNEKDEQNTLRIGSISSFIMTDLVNAFKKNYPSVNIMMFHDIRDNIDFMLRSSTLDIAIVDGLFNLDEHRFFPLTVSPMCLICHKDTRLHPALSGEQPKITIRELSTLPLFLWNSNQEVVFQLESAFREQGLSYTVQGRFLHFDGILRSVSYDLGIGLVSAANFSAPNDVFKIIEVEGLSLSFSQYLVCHKHNHNHPIVHAFIEFAQENIDSLKAMCQLYY